MTHGSLFAGIGGFDVGFEQAGFETVWQVEQDRFCIAVLKTRFPDVERYYEIQDCGHGRKHKLTAVDVVTGGFPCQDLSVAGKRAGLGGARSGLFWELARILGELRPPWIVIENVPGLFSSNDGQDFGVVLRTLADLGYGLAWRVLDSQFFGVPQRRRRVFIIGCFGEPCPTEVLFEPESCSRNPAPGREEGQDVASTVTGGTGRVGSKGCDDGANIVARALAQSSVSSGYRYDPNGEEYIVANAISSSAGHYGHSSPRGDGSDNLVCSTLNSGGNSGGFRTEPGEHIIIQDVRGCRDNRRNGIGITEGLPCYTLDADEAGAGQYVSTSTDADRMREFAELPEGMDSARYRALGNAVTVQVAYWIAQRIKAVAKRRST